MFPKRMPRANKNITQSSKLVAKKMINYYLKHKIAKAKIDRKAKSL